VTNVRRSRFNLLYSQANAEVLAHRQARFNRFLLARGYKLAALHLVHLRNFTDEAEPCDEANTVTGLRWAVTLDR
jgi:putative hemolysin